MKPNVLLFIGNKDDVYEATERFQVYYGGPATVRPDGRNALVWSQQCIYPWEIEHFEKKYPSLAVGSCQTGLGVSELCRLDRTPYSKVDVMLTTTETGAAVNQLF